MTGQNGMLTRGGRLVGPITGFSSDGLRCSFFVDVEVGLTLEDLETEDVQCCCQVVLEGGSGIVRFWVNRGPHGAGEVVGTIAP